MNNIAELPSARDLRTQAVEPYQGPFSSPEAFARSMQMARALASSPLVPKDYRGDENLGSVLIALDMASRLNANPLLVMQNLYIVEGRPSWSAQFLIATVNSSKRFSPLRFVLSDIGPEVTREVITGYIWDNSGPGKGRRVPQKGMVTYRQRECYATCRDLKSGEVLNGPVVTMDMAADEGWLGKSGSKWQTMPEVMLRYRAAAFWTRAYSPETSMGIQTEEEVREAIDLTRDESGSFSVSPASSTADLNASLQARAESARQQTEQQDQTDPAPSDQHPSASNGAASEQHEADSGNATEWPQANPETGELIDVRGIAWDKRIHSTAKKCNDDGTWCPRRGVDPRLITKLEREAMEAAVKAQNPELPLGGEPAATDPHPTEDWGNADQPTDPEPLTYETIRESMATAKDEDELNAWAEESRHVVITQSQRATLDLVYDQRMRQLNAGQAA